MSKKILLYLGSFILILLYVFRDLIFNLPTNLLDWRDYPYIIWTMFQSTTHITNLDFVNFFETNAFYPHKLTLMFSDLLLPQALILLPFLSITKNIILSFNITFLITFILNFIALFLFWKQIFKKDIIAFFGSLFFSFSPFFHLELSHFQMLSYWPFFFSFYFILKNEEKNEKRNLILAGLFITIQFLASVYLSVYLFFSIFIYYILKFISQKHLKAITFRILVILFVFLLTSGVFIKGYMDMKNIYNIKRDIREYITYSAHLSDYVFTSQIKSIIHQSPVMQIWNSADKNWSLHSSFPGFLIFILTLFGLFKISKEKKFITIRMQLNREKTFFLILVTAGFLFSLGPRLNFNGNYAHIPLPYTAVIKFAPFAEALRVPSRWSFLFFLGLIYFPLITLNKLGNKPHHKFIFLLVFIIFILEYIPSGIKSVNDSYINSDYQTLKKICSKEKKILLELPLTHLDTYPNIVEGLKYITMMELSSTYHQCFLVNGYSGYDLPDNFILSNTFNNYIKDQQTRLFLEELRMRNIEYIKFNQYYFIKELKPSITKFIDAIATESGVERVSNDLFYIKHP